MSTLFFHSLLSYIRQTAEVENNMNSAERITSYTDHAVPQEAAYEREDTEPAPSWPESGKIEMKDVFMSYRAGLPSVLKGINLSIKGGEKIGVVGRTGAGSESRLFPFPSARLHSSKRLTASSFAIQNPRSCLLSSVSLSESIKLQ